MAVTSQDDDETSLRERDEDDDLVREISKSYKRTFNAVLLLRATRPRSGAKPWVVSTMTIVGFAIANQIGLDDLLRSLAG
jgi:hypothetical protein